MRPLVILRPEPGASATAEAAGTLGLQPVVMPLFQIEVLEWSTPNPVEFDGLLLTSANAIRHGGSNLDVLRGLPAHCVGEATAGAAREAGFAIASVGASGVEVLVDALPPDLRLLHLCGADRHAPQAAGESVTAIHVYQAVELPTPERLGQVEGAVALLHSPRAARRFASLAEEAGVRRCAVALVAISDAAGAAAGDGWEAVEVASEPTDPALLAIAARLCNKPPR